MKVERALVCRGGHRPPCWLLVALVAAALACSVRPLHAAEEEQPAEGRNLELLEEQAFKQAAAVVDPSIVRIRTVGGLDRVGQVLTSTGATTGVVVSADGYVISSSFNFAAKPASVLVELPDGRRFPAETVATDRSKMLTLLRIEAKDLLAATAAPRDTLRVGQWALALGRTYDGPSVSVSVGIVSALDRIWGKAIQTDAKVSPVNYGGPLVDLRGRVMGILVPLSPQGTGETAGVEWYDSGIGFAIPLEDVYASLDRLKKGEDLKSGLLGIELRGSGVLAGEAIIDRVRVDSPAERAGLKRNDVIVEADGKPVGRQAELRHVLGRKYAGETVRIAIRRGEERTEHDITLVDELIPYESAFLGILPFREPAAGAAEAGVLVRHVFAESPAEKAGLQVRDRIVRIGEDDVADAAALLDHVGRLRPGQKAALAWIRDGREQSAEITFASVPADVPADLLSAAIPAARLPDEEQPEAAPDDDAPRTGRFTREMPAHERSCWAYVPEDYNPAYEYGLMVWIHPSGDTMEAAVFEKWKPICDRRGILILAPKAEKLSGWTPNEAEFVKDAILEFVAEYPVDRNRVFLHTFSDGGDLAWNVAFKHRELVRGMAAVASPLKVRPADHSPEFRMQFHLVCGDADNLFRNVQQSVGLLRGMKYPVSFTELPERDHRYPDPETIDEIGRWADCLDRI